MYQGGESKKYTDKEIEKMFPTPDEEIISSSKPPKGKVPEIKRHIKEDPDLDKALETNNPFYGTEGNEGYMEDMSEHLVEEEEQTQKPQPKKKAA